MAAKVCQSVQARDNQSGSFGRFGHSYSIFPLLVRSFRFCGGFSIPIWLYVLEKPWKTL